MSLTIAGLWTRNGMPEVVRAGATLLHGWLTAGPALSARPRPVAGRRPGLFRYRAHFTFALPGVATEAVSLDGFTIPPGVVVLSSIHATENDTTRTPDPGELDIRRRPKAVLAFGAGVHVCPGKALTRT